MTEYRPVLLRDYFGQIELKLNRVAVFRQLQSAAKPNDMGIAHYRRLTKGISQNAIGGLSAHARQRYKLIHRIRHTAGKLIDYRPAGPLDTDGLIMVKAGASYIIFDCFKLCFSPILRGFIFCEQDRA